jgi:hypothetical protein
MVAIIIANNADSQAYSIHTVPYIAGIHAVPYLFVAVAQPGDRGLDAWKIGKDIALFLGVVFTICLVYAQRRGNKAFNLLLGLTILYGALHIIVWLAHPDSHDRSAAIGTIYNMRLPLSALLGYGAILLLPKFAISSVIKIVLIISTIVAGLGVLQYFLPADLLTNLGYSLDRGVRAAFFVEDNPDLPRIMSTLREPNALGAYLLLPIAAISTFLLRTDDKNKRYILTGALGLHLLAVFFTFSRSAWLAAALVLALVTWWRFRSVIVKPLHRFWPVAVGLVFVVGFAAFALRNTSLFQQYIIHSDPKEQVVDLDSNDLHILLIREGLEGVADKALWPWPRHCRPGFYPESARRATHRELLHTDWLRGRGFGAPAFCLPERLVLFEDLEAR